jgi:deazaflavin-dependent oxidoreductase (nitroreductase family)
MGILQDGELLLAKCKALAGIVGAVRCKMQVMDTDIDPTQAARDAGAMREFNRSLIAEFRAGGGQLGGRFAGVPVLLLSTVGARSGAPRTTPLNYTRDGDRYVVVASKRGAPTNPAWYHNLLARPTASIEVGTERFEVRWRVAEGEERDRLYAELAAQLPLFADYQRRTSRRIPVLVLERAG